MKNLTLVIDIGNTTTIYGVFDNKTFIKSLVTLTHDHSESEKTKLLDKFLYDNDFKISKGMIFSVVPVESIVVQRIVEKVTSIKLDIFDPKGYKNLETSVDDPKEIGADLIADIVGAKALYGHPVVIIDLGTVNKLLYVNKNGVFTGCSFFPGMQTSLSLFNEKTALLPEIEEFKSSPGKLGTNTLDAMNHGVYWSVVSYIERVQREFNKDAKLIITGGNCQIIAGEIKNKIIDPELTIKGMNIIFMELEKWIAKD